MSHALSSEKLSMRFAPQRSVHQACKGLFEDLGITSIRQVINRSNQQDRNKFGVTSFFTFNKEANNHTASSL